LLSQDKCCGRRKGGSSNWDTASRPVLFFIPKLEVHCPDPFYQSCIDYVDTFSLPSIHSSIKGEKIQFVSTSCKDIHPRREEEPQKPNPEYPDLTPNSPVIDPSRLAETIHPRSLNHFGKISSYETSPESTDNQSCSLTSGSFNQVTNGHSLDVWVPCWCSLQCAWCRYPSSCCLVLACCPTNCLTSL